MFQEHNATKIFQVEHSILKKMSQPFDVFYKSYFCHTRVIKPKDDDSIIITNPVKVRCTNIFAQCYWSLSLCRTFLRAKSNNCYTISRRRRVETQTMTPFVNVQIKIYVIHNACFHTFQNNPIISWSNRHKPDWKVISLCSVITSNPEFLFVAQLCWIKTGDVRWWTFRPWSTRTTFLVSLFETEKVIPWTKSFFVIDLNPLWELM